MSIYRIRRWRRHWYGKELRNWLLIIGRDQEQDDIAAGNAHITPRNEGSSLARDRDEDAGSREAEITYRATVSKAADGDGIRHEAGIRCCLHAGDASLSSPMGGEHLVVGVDDVSTPEESNEMAWLLAIQNRDAPDILSAELAYCGSNGLIRECGDDLFCHHVCYGSPLRGNVDSTFNIG